MTKPKASEELVRTKFVEAMGEIPDSWKLFIIAVRGYYFKSMGNPNKNDRGVFDDAFFVFGPSGFKAFRGNTDPSAYKQGVASLCPNFTYWYKKGLHGISKKNPYPAFRPASKDELSKVTRDGVKNPWDGQAINLHHGSASGGTSSLGCQTVPYEDWNEFYDYVTNEMKLASVDKFPYTIINGPIN